MAQSRLLGPLRVLGRIFTPPGRSTTPVFQSHSLLQRTPKPTTPLSRSPFLPFSPVRHASHAAQGSANKHASRPAGKRLGAKRTGGEYVVPGCIIFRQKGTAWFPGENCAMGRDHSIYATERGYVRYYLDPELHPDRKYIGIALQKDDKLPRPRNAPAKRRLNKELAPRLSDRITQGSEMVTAGEPSATADGVPGEGVQLRPGYMYREMNWHIGRAAEKAGISVKPFDRKNRWLAWRRRQAKVEHAAKMRSLKGKSKGGKKKGKGRR